MSTNRVKFGTPITGARMRAKLPAKRLGKLSGRLDAWSVKWKAPADPPSQSAWLRPRCARTPGCAGMCL